MHLFTPAFGNGLCVIDFPGSNDMAASVRSVTKQGISCLDLVVIILEARQVTAAEYQSEGSTL
jgi:hypothetical protein